MPSGLLGLLPATRLPFAARSTTARASAQPWRPTPTPPPPAATPSVTPHPHPPPTPQKPHNSPPPTYNRSSKASPKSLARRTGCWCSSPAALHSKRAAGRGGQAWQLTTALARPRSLTAAQHKRSARQPEQPKPCRQKSSPTCIILTPPHPPPPHRHHHHHHNPIPLGLQPAPDPSSPSACHAHPAAASQSARTPGSTSCGSGSCPPGPPTQHQHHEAPNFLVTDPAQPGSLGLV